MNLLCLAVGRSTGLTASDLEIKREGISYTVDTVRDLARQFDVFLLMGHDSFAALETWHQYKDLFDHCRLIVMVRPGFQGIDWSRFSDPVRKMYPGEVICLNADQQIPSREIFKDTWKICILEIHGLEISASVIRDRVRQGRSIRFFTPDKVVDYIKRHKLYLNDGGVHDQSPYPSHQ